MDEDRPYTSVKVLMIKWKDSSQKEFGSQLTALATEFKAYNFDVEEYDIESEMSHVTLGSRLIQFLSYNEEGRLLIVYYGGHGIDNQDKDCIWLR
jgi:hypothetical protein